MSSLMSIRPCSTWLRLGCLTPLRADKHDCVMPSSDMTSRTMVERSIGSVPGSVVARLRRIDTGRGREDLYRNQLRALLTELALRARVESITASSALEGIVVPDPVRAVRIIEGKVPVFRNRSEQEFAGYRAALDYLMTDTWQPLNIGLLLHLHALLFEKTEGGGGAFKSSDNLVVDRSSDGTIEVRFVPVPAARTEFYTAELISRFNSAAGTGAHHPILLIGLFALDLLTIHPFDDGNGRVARALTNALLTDADYGVGRYVSLEGSSPAPRTTTTTRSSHRRTGGTRRPTTPGPGCPTSSTRSPLPTTPSNPGQRPIARMAPSRSGYGTTYSTVLTLCSGLPTSAPPCQGCRTRPSGSRWTRSRPRDSSPPRESAEGRSGGGCARNSGQRQGEGRAVLIPVRGDADAA